MTNSKFLTFPVIAYKEKESALYVFLKREELIKTSVRLYNEKIYEGVFFIDSNGDLYKVISVEKTGWGTPLWGYNLMYKGRLIKIEFILEKVDHLSLTKFKEVIHPRAKRHSPDFGEVEDRFIAASTYEDVIRITQ